MADRNEHNPEHDSEREAYEQLYRGSSTLLKLGNLSWTHRLLLDQVEALSGRKLNEAEKSASHENDVVPGKAVESGSGASHENVRATGETIIVGDLRDVHGIAIGSGAAVSISTDEELREMQYEFALNWDGKRPLRGFDLSERDLSGLNLANADLRKANLKAADLNKANLVKADLSEADLRDANLAGADLSDADLAGARYTASTTWPGGFEPEKAGAVLVTGKVST